MSTVSYANSVKLLIIAKQYAVASWTLALYELIITFGQEVESIWCLKFTFANVLWFFNRYTVHISFFPTIIAFFLRLTDEQCLRFVRFPGVMQIIFNISSGITLSLRTFAFYERAWWTLWLLIPSLLAEIAVESWAVAGGAPAILPKGQIGCILSGKPEQGIRFAAFWMGQLYFPALIFILTISRAFHTHRIGLLKGGILQIMFRDGILYFFVIFLANLANVLGFVVLPEEIKFINAPFSNVITSLMICRLTLNLRARPFSDVEQSEQLSTSLDFEVHNLDMHTYRSPGILASRMNQTRSGSTENRTLSDRSSI